MAHAFTPIPAKPTFGTLKENLYQSDYINRKKSRLVYCRTPSYCNIFPINKGNLIMGQYTKLNLNNICTVSNGTPPTQPCSNNNPCEPCQNNIPVIINPNYATEPFYFGATIDPLGELFGASQCGELNYTHYMVYKNLHP